MTTDGGDVSQRTDAPRSSGEDREFEARCRVLEARAKWLELRAESGRRSKRPFWLTPVNGTLAVAAFGLLGTLWQWNRDVQRQRLADKTQFALKLLETGNWKEAKENLRFLVRSRLVDDPDGAIASALESTNPVLPAQRPDSESTLKARPPSVLPNSPEGASLLSKALDKDTASIAIVFGTSAVAQEVADMLARVSAQKPWQRTFLVAATIEKQVVLDSAHLPASKETGDCYVILGGRDKVVAVRGPVQDLLTTGGDPSAIECRFVFNQADLLP